MESEAGVIGFEHWFWGQVPWWDCCVTDVVVTVDCWKEVCQGPRRMVVCLWVNALTGGIPVVAGVFARDSLTASAADAASLECCVPWNVECQ